MQRGRPWRGCETGECRRGVWCLAGSDQAAAAAGNWGLGHGAALQQILCRQSGSWPFHCSDSAGHDLASDHRCVMSYHNKSLFVKGLNEETTQHDLRDLFSRYGTVNDIYIPMSYHTRRPRGFAYVAFDSLDEAKRAVRKLDGTVYNGREIKVEHAQGDRKTPHEMREKDGPRNQNGNRSRRRSFSRERDRPDRSDRPDFSRPRRRSRSPHRPLRRRSSSPTVSARSRSSRTLPAGDSAASDRHQRPEQRPDHRTRDRFPSPSSRSKRRDGGDSLDDRSHRRTDHRAGSRERASHHSHRNSDDKDNGSRRSGSREA